MSNATHYICSNRTICQHNILPQILTYLVLHQCTDLRELFDGQARIPFKHNVSHSTIHDIIDNPDGETLPALLKEKRTPNSTNIVIGPELADYELMYSYNKQFQMYDKLLKSDGVVVIVRYQELDIHRLIISSVEGTQGLLVASMLLATIISFVIWFTVSNI